MGNSIEKADEENQDLYELQKNCAFIKEFEDISFGEIQLYQNLENQMHIAVKQKYFEDSQNFVQLRQEAEIRVKYKQRNILQLIGFRCASQSKMCMCGSNHKMYLYYEYANYTLEQEIAKRFKKTEYFTEEEILYILQAVCSAGKYYQEARISHGDLRSETIFIDQEGYIKIGDHGLTNSHPTNFLKAFILSEKVNLSPILLKALKNKDKEPIHNVFKSDIWSLGLTILEACTLMSAQTIYNYDDYSINLENIQDSLIKRVQNRYSQKIVEILSKMLDVQEQNRPDFIQLYSQLSQMEPDQISSKINSQQFIVVKEVPPSPQIYTSGDDMSLPYTPSQSHIISNQKTYTTPNISEYNSQLQPKNLELGLSQQNPNLSTKNSQINFSYKNSPQSLHISPQLSAFKKPEISNLKIIKTKQFSVENEKSNIARSSPIKQEFKDKTNKDNFFDNKENKDNKNILQEKINQMTKQKSTSFTSDIFGRKNSSSVRIDSGRLDFKKKPSKPASKPTQLKQTKKLDGEFKKKVDNYIGNKEIKDIKEVQRDLSKEPKKLKTVKKIKK